MSFIEELQKRVYERTKMFATWLPTDKVRVGEYGSISGGRFRYEGHVEGSGIPCNEHSFVAKNSKISFSHRASFVIRSGLKGDIAGIGGPLMEILFHAAGGLVYQMKDISMKRIANKPEVYKHLAGALLTGSLPWPDNYVFIDEVRQAGCATILVSQSGESSLTLKGAIPMADEKDAPLADIAAGVSVDIRKGSVFCAVCTELATPLYGARRFSFRKDEDDSAVGITMLTSWFKSTFKRDSVHIDEIEIGQFAEVNGVEVLTLLDKVSGNQFSLTSHPLGLHDFHDPNGPRGPSGDGLVFEERNKQASTGRVRRGARRTAYGRGGD